MSIKNLPFEWLVGLRYTRAGSRSGRNSFISFISLISMAGIALGVAALIVVLSVMNGFQKEVRDRMLSVLPHIEVFDAVRHACPTGRQPRSEALQQRRSAGRRAVCRDAGHADPRRRCARRDGPRRAAARKNRRCPMWRRRCARAASTICTPGEFNIVLGGDLARGMHVTRGRQGHADCAARAGDAGRRDCRALKQFTVVGIFDAGHYEYDSALAFIHIDDAMRMFQHGRRRPACACASPTCSARRRWRKDLSRSSMTAT